MQLTVFGASGKVGREVVVRALAKGWHVVAFVHSHDPFDMADRLVVVRGDINDRLAVERALVGSGAVISALGSWGTADKNVLTEGMRTIIPAMEKQGLSRLVTLTGAGARCRGDKPNLFDRLSHAALRLAAPKILSDGEEHLRLLETSRLDWTCVRSPVMKRRGSERYRLGGRPPSVFDRVSRAAVARCLVALAESEEFEGKAPFIYPPAPSSLLDWPKLL